MFTTTLNKFLRPIVYGGMDGSVTTFAVVTASAAAGFSATVILVLGFANALADGFSMAVGSYLSEKSERQMNDGHGHGFDRESFMNASATFISFIIVGAVPLAPYVYSYIVGADMYVAFWISIILTLIAFALIGLMRGIVTKTSKWVATLEAFGLGTVAALISYAAGGFLESILR